MPTKYLPRARSNKHAYPRTCDVCKVMFNAKHPRAKYHSNACRQRAKREREQHEVMQFLILEKDYRTQGKPVKAKQALAAAREIRKSARRLW